MANRQTYGFAYSGAIGIGFGVLSVTDGKVVGQDCAGASYEGSADVVEGGIRLHLKMLVPPGIGLVSGATPQELPHFRDIDHTFPPEFGAGAPQRLDLDLGVVHLLVQRLPDEFNHVVEEGFHLAAARP